MVVVGLVGVVVSAPRIFWPAVQLNVRRLSRIVGLADVSIGAGSSVIAKMLFKLASCGKRHLKKQAFLMMKRA